MWTAEGLGRGRWAAPVCCKCGASHASGTSACVRCQGPAALCASPAPSRSAPGLHCVPGSRSFYHAFLSREAGAPTGGLASRCCGVSAVPGRGGVMG